MTTKKTLMAAAFACAMTPLAYSQTAVDQQITAPTSFAGNSTDLFAASAANSASSVVSPTTNTVVTDTFNAAVNQLNASVGTLGSALHYQNARAALDANLASVPLQAALVQSQRAYNKNVTTIDNLKNDAMVTASNKTHKTYDGASGSPIGDSVALTEGDGSSKLAQAAAQQDTDNVGVATAYYANGGTTLGQTVDGGKSDLEAGVIAPIQALSAVPAALDTNNNGFLDTDEALTAAAATALATAESNLDTLIGITSTPQPILDAAASALVTAQNNYVTAVNSQYANFSPLNSGSKAALLGTILNGSWERSAILAGAAGTAANAADIVTGDAATLAAANTYTDGEVATEAAARIQGDADTLAAANTYTDGEVATEAAARIQGDADTLAAANTYTDGEVATEAAARIQGDADTLASANTYTDGEVATEAAARIQGDADTLASANTYTDGEVATEKARALAAENALGFRITDETNDRMAADVNLQNQINSNAGAIANNSNRIASNKADIQTNTRGIAMVAAMTNTTVLPGNTSAIDFNLSHFEGETGFGFGYARAINPNLQLKIAVASTTDFDESVVRAGVSYQW